MSGPDEQMILRIKEVVHDSRFEGLVLDSGASARLTLRDYAGNRHTLTFGEPEYIVIDGSLGQFLAELLVTAHDPILQAVKKRYEEETSPEYKDYWLSLRSFRFEGTDGLVVAIVSASVVVEPL